MGFTLAGETLQRLLPLPIPASVYGLVLLFAANALSKRFADTSIF